VRTGRTGSSPARSAPNTYFRERDGGFLDAVGFVYLPEGLPADPPTDTSITYAQLRGPWYTFVEAW
jgi:hypothetical protein